MPHTPRRLGGSRTRQLKAMLEKRHRELGAQLKDALHERRAHEWKLRSSAEGVEEADPGELELALVELKADMRKRVAASLTRLAEGAYGRCATCGLDIALARLEALPFAVRCRDCEAVREEAHRKTAVGRDKTFGMPALGEHSHTR